jgi:tetratricopeptide (TPR) repeat protein
MGLNSLLKRGLESLRHPVRTRRRSLPGQMFNTYRAGDYQATLQLCNQALSARMDVAVFRGEVLVQLNQMDEAVRTLTAAVSASKTPKAAALANCALGQAYLLQHSLDKALDCFKTSYRQWPERGATHRSLAEIWLRRENQAEALKWARTAVERDRAERAGTPQTKAANLAADLAVLALTIAANSRDVGEVERSATEATGLCGGLAVTSVAQVHLYCGLACKVIGNAVKAAEHLETAVRVDPHGIWGREAQKFAPEPVAAR